MTPGAIRPVSNGTIGQCPCSRPSGVRNPQQARLYVHLFSIAVRRTSCKMSYAAMRPTEWTDTMAVIDPKNRSKHDMHQTIKSKRHPRITVTGQSSRFLKVQSQPKSVEVVIEKSEARAVERVSGQRQSRSSKEDQLSVMQTCLSRIDQASQITSLRASHAAIYCWLGGPCGGAPPWPPCACCAAIAEYHMATYAW